MKSIFKNKLNLFLFFLLVINLIYIKNISYFKLEIIKNSFNKNWIPIYSIYRPEVIESKYLLNKHKISKFNVSQKIIGEKDLDFSSANTIKATDLYTYFRIVAYNYPIRLDSQSKYFLFFLNEKTSEKCKELDKGKYLKLLIC
ncbi:MAG: hypothetical protein QGF61_04545 [Pelagibacteraceae bacterium]|jgi:hypothetical protein|nr:hypothetical protein [Pelagibacteraceae bacterium]|tara:strand:+ start:3617 stop:4045 length:429 start_codon:yes stop_codon:yes gene_type:complete